MIFKSLPKSFFLSVYIFFKQYHALWSFDLNSNDHLVLCDIAIVISIMFSLNFIQKSDGASPYNWIATEFSKRERKSCLVRGRCHVFLPVEHIFWSIIRKF